MKKVQVEIDKVYACKVSGNIVPVRIDSESRFGGWNGTNMITKRHVRIKTAGKLRYSVYYSQVLNKWTVMKGGGK